jgi:hypothetical protein
MPRGSRSWRQTVLPDHGQHSLQNSRHDVNPDVVTLLVAASRFRKFCANPTRQGERSLRSDRAVPCLQVNAWPDTSIVRNPAEIG